MQCSTLACVAGQGVGRVSLERPKRNLSLDANGVEHSTNLENGGLQLPILTRNGVLWRSSRSRLERSMRVPLGKL